MRYLITGGAGFIGSNLVDELICDNEVTVYDNFSEGTIDNIAHHKGNINIVNGDVRDYEKLLKVSRGIDIVFHMAAMSRIQPSINNPLDAFSVNIMGTANVLEAARKAGVSRVVYSASSSAYGCANKAHAMNGGFTEDLPSDCNSPYAMGKHTGEKLCDFYREFYGLSTCSLRYFNVYGPRQQETGAYSVVIGIFMRQLREGTPFSIVGNGTQRRDFTHVYDVVNANLLASERDCGGVINIGYGKNYSIIELARMIGPDHPMQFFPPRLGEYPMTLSCCDKAKKVLGWQPAIPLERGLKML